jgi:hypothetical protein
MWTTLSKKTHPRHRSGYSTVGLPGNAQVGLSAGPRSRWHCPPIERTHMPHSVRVSARGSAALWAAALARFCRDPLGRAGEPCERSQPRSRSASEGSSPASRAACRNSRPRSLGGRASISYRLVHSVSYATTSSPAASSSLTEAGVDEIGSCGDEANTSSVACRTCSTVSAKVLMGEIIPDPSSAHAAFRAHAQPRTSRVPHP